MKLKLACFLSLLTIASPDLAKALDELAPPPPAARQWDQVDMTVDEYVDGVPNGKSEILSARVVANGTKPIWDILIVEFEADDADKSVWTDVYRVGNSSLRAGFGQPVAALERWIPGSLIEFENVSSGPYIYHLLLRHEKGTAGRSHWTLKCTGTYKRVDSAPLQKFELVPAKKIGLKFDTLKCLQSPK